MPGPDFILIGAAKAATSSLCVSLQYHPEIHIPGKKEFNFFSFDDVYQRGFDWYHSQFSTDSKSVTGEGSVSYSFFDAHPNTAMRIQRYRPAMKIIYIVREPVARLMSLYRQFQAAGTLGPVSFFEALQTHPALLDSGRYWKQISAYRDLFPDDQIKVIFFDDWKDNPNAVVKECCEFLNVDPDVRLPVSQKGQTIGQMQDSKLLWRLRNVSGFNTARNIIPQNLRRLIRPLVKTRITEKPAISQETARFLEHELAEDVATFLTFYGRPGLWDLTALASKTKAA